jgi:TrmH family RNA methyltransferase
MKDIEYVKKSVERLFLKNPRVHIDVVFSRPKLMIENDCVTIVGVYANLFRIEENISTLITQVRSQGFTVYGAHPRGGAKAGDQDLYVGKTALIIGNEGAGLTEAAKRGSDCLVTIPMPGRAESLNAGIAASVLMYEVIRRKEDA